MKGVRPTNESCKEQLLQCSAYLSALQPGSLSHEDALILLSASVSIADRLLEVIEEKRVCPGRYWRLEPAIAATIVAHNKAAHKKKKVETGGQCCGVFGDISFDRGYVGPPREGNLPRHLCNTCGRALDRDKKNGFIPPV